MVEIGEAETHLTRRHSYHGKRVVILVNDKRSATLSDKPNAQKKKVVSTGFSVIRAVTTFNGLKIPFREVTAAGSRCLGQSLTWINPVWPPRVGRVARGG